MESWSQALLCVFLHDFPMGQIWISMDSMDFIRGISMDIHTTNLDLYGILLIMNIGMRNLAFQCAMAGLFCRL